MSNQAYARPEQVKANIVEVAGVDQFYSGQSSGSVQTKGGIEQMVNRATLRDNIQIQNIGFFLTDLTELL